MILPHLSTISNTLFHTGYELPLSPNPLFWESHYLQFSSQLIQNLFIQYIEHIDELFFHSVDRKHTYYSKDKQSKTLVTLFGTITFKRRRYINKLTGSSFHYIDYLLGISKYQRVSNQVIAQVLHNISFEHDSYRKATQQFGLSKSFAYYQIKKLNPDVYVPYLLKPISCDNLHIVADEDHIAIQDKKRKRKKESTNSYMLRHVTIFTDISKVCKNRNQLKNRMILTQLENESVQEFSQRVNDFILDNYRVYDKAYVYGDGAAWIQTLAHETGSLFILDKFHMKQALFRVCGGKTNKPIRDILEKYLELDNYEMFEKVVKVIYANNLSQFKTKNLRYIKNFWSSYQKNFKIPQALWCCAEGINSHYFSEYFSSRPKGFSKSHIHKIGYLLSLSHSSYDIRKYYIENIQDFIEEKKDTNYTYQNKKHLETFHNIPILNNGETKGIYHLLNNLIHKTN